MRVSSAAAAALAVASLGAACGGTSSGSPSTAAQEPTSGALPTRVRGNQVILTAKDSRTLLEWAQRFRGCLAERGLRTSVHVTRRDVSMEVAGGGMKQELVKVGTACGELLGGPPRRASLQVFDGVLVLYLPKQCLLDAKVAAGRA